MNTNIHEECNKNSKKIYLDNGATSFPKPQEVSDAVYYYMTNVGTNINRGGYEAAYDVEGIVYDTRQMISDMFGAGDSKNVIFTKNITESLNVVLKGFLKPGDHILCSSIEHNAVMRPLVQLQSQGIIEFDRIPCDKNGILDLSKISSLIRDNTKAIVMTHASNVNGTINPIKEVGKICNDCDKDIKFIVDSAQTAGALPISMTEMNIDALCFTGHKSLLGPQGTGGFIINDDMVDLICPIIAGGTGSISHTEIMPDFMPDKFESGTMNIPGIIGLNQGIKWVLNRGLDNILKHELELTKKFIDGISDLIDSGDIALVGIKGTKGRTGVVSIQTLKHDLAEVAFMLDNQYGIMTRVGLHCAPSAHKSFGTYPTGTIRFSFGNFNTSEDVEVAVKALYEICNA